MRTFISIDLPEKIKKEIVKIQERLPEFKGKLTEFENLHLTLKFLGETDEKKLEEIKRRLKKIKLNSFEAEINSVGVFSDRIVWLGIKNCNELQKEIDKNLNGLFEKEKRFMGHLTIARIKEIKDKKKFLNQLNKIKMTPMEFLVNDFNIKKSILTEKGPVYDIVENYELN
jgi:2'-5' RNA ligase